MNESLRRGMATAMSQHVWMDRELQLGPSPDPTEQRMEGFGRHRSVRAPPRPPDSERFRSTPRTSGRFRGILSLP
jgi:hypothetical protein